jgi:hypothetical protein
MNERERRDGREAERRNGSEAVPSLKIQQTEPTHIWRAYSSWSRSAPIAPHPDSRGSGSTPLRSIGSPTKHTVTEHRRECKPQVCNTVHKHSSNKMQTKTVKPQNSLKTTVKN